MKTTFHIITISAALCVEICAILKEKLNQTMVFEIKSGLKSSALHFQSAMYKRPISEDSGSRSSGS